MTMNKIHNIDDNIVADFAARIERLITDARANVARSVNKIGSTFSAQLPIENPLYTVDQIQKSTTSSRKSAKVSPFTLSCSHYVVLMRIESEEERHFYEMECQKQNWNVCQLQRQYNSSLYERLALSRNKDEIMRLAQDGQTFSKPNDILKNPLTLEFLGFKPDVAYSKTKIVNASINKMQHFLLELGKGFQYLRPAICPLFAG